MNEGFHESIGNVVVVLCLYSGGLMSDEQVVHRAIGVTEVFIRVDHCLRVICAFVIGRQNHVSRSMTDPLTDPLGSLIRTAKAPPVRRSWYLKYLSHE